MQLRYIKMKHKCQIHVVILISSVLTVQDSLSLRFLYLSSFHSLRLLDPPLSLRSSFFISWEYVWNTFERSLYLFLCLSFAMVRWSFFALQRLTYLSLQVVCLASVLFSLIIETREKKTERSDRAQRPYRDHLSFLNAYS